MRFWIVPLITTISLATEVKASSNVEPELCYQKIHAAIKAGAQSGRFELRDANCEKYKPYYDLEFGEPSRPRLTGEGEYPRSLNWPENNTESRDACWDVLVASKYDKNTMKENQDCVDFIKAAGIKPWSSYWDILK